MSHSMVLGSWDQKWTPAIRGLGSKVPLGKYLQLAETTI